MSKKNVRRRRYTRPWTQLRSVARLGNPLRRSQPGDPPGQLHDDPGAFETTIRLVAYGTDQYVEATLENLDEVQAYRDRFDVVWLDVEGVGDASVLQRVGEIFALPKLALEDVQDLSHRPKVELFDHGAQLVLTMPYWQETLEFEQVSIFVGLDFVVTFQVQSGPLDRFDAIRARLLRERSAIRRHGADYLAYAIIDRVIDAGFPVLDEFAEMYRELELEVVGPATRDLLMRIHTMNSQLLTLYRSVWPHIDLISTLKRHVENAKLPPEKLFSDEIAPYLKDCSDHAIQIAELAKHYHEMGNQLLGFSVSLAGHRQNEITKVLTIIATIFIPLTFIAGVYGMNFNPASSPWNMPELNWPYAYPVTLAVMALIAVGLIYFFWRKGWLRQG